MSATARHDAVIVGGGLAGLTLALQLRRRFPDLDVAVLERRRWPVPETTHKIGESTVELGSHYLADVVGLRDHLDGAQLRKFGLRFFFGAGDGDIEQADELGVSRVFSTPTWQVDRGVLENELARRAEAAGVTLHAGTVARRIELNGTRRVHFEGPEARGVLDARWLIDAASRASPLKRTLGLQRENDHDVNANWFRVEGELRVDDWSDDPEWSSRTGETPRWLSTNQLMGPGYWIWIIPLATGATSIGIVADPRFHPLDELRTLDASLAWLERHQPRLAAALSGHRVLDFAFLRHFSHDCERVFSGERWALTGEAGMFLDPLYSPGTDFIAIGNTLVTDLVARDLAGEDITRRARAQEAVFRSLYENTLSIYKGLYGGFGDISLMALKSTWDYAFYWSVLALLFFQRAMDTLVDDAALRTRLLAAVALNHRMQKRFRHAAAQAKARPGRGRFFDQQDVPLMGRLNRELHDSLAPPELAERIERNTGRLERLAAAIERRMDAPDRATDDAERALLGSFPDLLRA